MHALNECNVVIRLQFLINPKHHFGWTSANFWKRYMATTIQKCAIWRTRQQKLGRRNAIFVDVVES